MRGGGILCVSDPSFLIKQGFFAWEETAEKKGRNGTFVNKALRIRKRNEILRKNSQKGGVFSKNLLTKRENYIIMGVPNFEKEGANHA